MEKEYENIVMQHYSEVAREEKDSALSTMKNEYVRNKETESILKTIEWFLGKTDKEHIRCVDVGCGNGYTLSVLKEKINKIEYIGIEKNDDLRNIAKNRFRDNCVQIVSGDIRNIEETGIENVDIVICQRVIINLLDEEDQKVALSNLGKIVNKGGIIILIECMNESLKKLNEARNEFQLEPISPSFHNLYMDKKMLDYIGKDFIKCENKEIPATNFLSTHYYISRVLHDVALNGKPFMRNSNFVSFMDEFFDKNIGDYSPINFFVFQK